MADRPCSLQNTGAGYRGEGGQGGGQGSGQGGGQGVCPLEGWSSYVRDHVTVGAGRWRRWRSAAAAGPASNLCRTFPTTWYGPPCGPAGRFAHLYFRLSCVYMCRGAVWSQAKEKRDRDIVVYIAPKMPQTFVKPKLVQSSNACFSWFGFGQG